MDLGKILRDHQSRYPLWQVQDLYKLLHQAALGSEHAVIDLEQAGSWLEEECAHCQRSSNEKLLDPISPDSQLVRVHLVPYLKFAFDLSILNFAFYQTARDFKGSIDLLEGYSLQSLELSNHVNLSFSTSELRSFIDEKRLEGFPAVHHSSIYRKAYQPAYRVVHIDYLSEKLRSLLP